MEKIGARLKQQRLSKRLSFEEVNTAIRTPLKYLAALEEDDVSVFPAEVYYFGSLRRYATYIGLNADELIDAYRNNKLAVVQDAVPEKKEGPGKSTKKLLWIGALIVISAAVLAVVILLILKGSEIMSYIPENQPSAQQPVKQEAAKVPPPVSQPKAVKQPEQVKVENKPAGVKEEAGEASGEDEDKRYNLEVEALSSCWVKITADGNTVFASTLEKGAKKHWSADNEMGIVIGYVPGLRVKLNGKDIDITNGAKQDINELHFKAEDGQ